MSLGRGRASHAGCNPSQAAGVECSHGASHLDADVGTGADLFLGPSFVI